MSTVKSGSELDFLVNPLPLDKFIALISLSHKAKWTTVIKRCAKRKWVILAK